MDGNLIRQVITNTIWYQYELTKVILILTRYNNFGQPNVNRDTLENIIFYYHHGTPW